RQVGKTFIVNTFGKNEFDSFVTLNFERNPEYKDIFTTNDPADIIEKMILFTGEAIERGKTLVFLDEIQECPSAIMSLRYFYEEMPDLFIIGAGSLLEFSLKAENFRMPVGRVQYLYMYPISFSEFLDAIGEDSLNEHISNFQNIINLPESLHKKLIEYVKKYFILGGMPAVVNEYIESQDILKCQAIQHLLIETYIDDFPKYARQSKFKYLKKVFTASSSMVGQKFIYTKIDSSVKSRELKEAFELLETAGILYRVKRTSGAGLPLETGVKENFYKTVFLDIGLMHAINGIYSETIKENDLTAIYKGAVAEQFFGQELITLQNNHQKPKLYYWARESKNSSAEIDYIIEKDNKIIPIEIKSGPTGRIKSLKMFLEIYRIKKGVKVSQAMYGIEKKIISLPFYAIKGFLTDN
ncbi:MAG: AAA family ATPase, partial [Planctomycetia bacterium]|nr:AAA family ATPase [Planctomycetia bacterium]